MNKLDFKKLLTARLKDPSTYWLAIIVGTLINLYGQILVPWMRGVESPWLQFIDGASAFPGSTLLSVSLGYIFPFCVGIYSTIAIQQKNQRVASIVGLPEHKVSNPERAPKSAEHG
ncbi:MAG: hypothetical protein ACI8P9_005067 [Parasphingorhabdus sp.]